MGQVFSVFTKSLRVYIVWGCILQFIVFRILAMAAIQTRLAFERHGIDHVSLLTAVSLHMHPALAVFNFGLVLFATYAIIKKKSDMVLLHTLGCLLLTSIGAVIFQGFGSALPFAGTLIGIIEGE